MQHMRKNIVLCLNEIQHSSIVSLAATLLQGSRHCDLMTQRGASSTMIASFHAEGHVFRGLTYGVPSRETVVDKSRIESTQESFFIIMVCVVRSSLRNCMCICELYHLSGCAMNQRCNMASGTSRGFNHKEKPAGTLVDCRDAPQLHPLPDNARYK